VVSVAIADTIALMKSHQASRECEISFSGPAYLELDGYPVLIHQLVMNLILNAAEATQGIGRILIELAETDRGVSIAVSDNGTGIDEAARETVFSAFYTSKPAGSGLGLTSVRSSVDIHGGEIEIGNSASGGARFLVRLPHLDERRVAELKSDKTMKLETNQTFSSSSSPL
ncbi:MAG: ATP-binding protein, partial [Bdellovibrionota bacterium]